MAAKISTPAPKEYSVCSIARKLATGSRYAQISMVEKLHIYQVVSRVWRRHLTADEFMVMTYLIDRTVGWGTDRIKVGHRNVLEGTEKYSGVGLKERTYYKVLNSLLQKGMIERVSHPNCVDFIVNVAWPEPRPAYGTLELSGLMGAA